MLARKYRWELLQLGVIAAMFITAAVRWSSVPDRIPIHWNAAGEVDGYGGKFMGLLFLPLLVLGLYFLLAFLPRLDPARANYSPVRGPYLAIRVGFVLYMGFLYALTNLAIGNEESLPMDRLLFGAAGGLFIMLGAVMGKMRPSYFAGIRTPWTLTSKKSWVKTHRLGGWVFIAAGVATAIAAIFDGLAALITMFAVLILGVVLLSVYSYVFWKGDTERVAAQDTRPAADS
jgi:uncharacterized membrane protein